MQSYSGGLIPDSRIACRGVIRGTALHPGSSTATAQYDFRREFGPSKPRNGSARWRSKLSWIGGQQSLQHPNFAVNLQLVYRSHMWLPDSWPNSSSKHQCRILAVHELMLREWYTTCSFTCVSAVHQDRAHQLKQEHAS